MFLDSSEQRMQTQVTKSTAGRMAEKSGSRLNKVLLVGEVGLFPGPASHNFYFGAQRARIAGRAAKLSEALPRLESSVIDVVLLGREFSPEELLLFAVNAKSCGFRGVILQAEPALSKATELAVSPKRRPIHAGDFVIDVDKHRVWVRGSETPLTPQEFALLTYFTQHPRELLSHETLLETLWGKPTAPIEPLRVLIQTLRAKVDTSVPPRYIVTQHRLGYRFNPSPYPIPGEFEN